MSPSPPSARPPLGPPLGPPHRLASFDVFDTVLTRVVSPPAAVFLLLGRRLRELGLTTLEPAAFAAARTKAERDAAGSGDATAINLVTLDRIYERLELAGAITTEHTAAARHVELELEDRLGRPVPAMLARINAERSRGVPIAFLSDMYLPPAFIAAMLSRHGAFHEGDTLLVSSDIGVDKRSGGLFAELARRTGVAPADILHVGDNINSDVRAAARAGVRAEHFTALAPSRFTDILEAAAGDTGTLGAALAGAVRLAMTPMSDARRHIGAHVAAPVLSAFVLWVFARARALGIRRLYFLARDGQQLLHIAERLLPQVENPPELRYLPASRQAWHLPSVTAIGDTERAWLLAPARNLTLARLLGRVGLNVGDMLKPLSAAGLPTSPDAPIDAERLDLARALFTDPHVVRLVLDRAADARAIATDFLRQEGLFDADRWAIVDVGWSARSQASLAGILAAAGGPSPRGLYFGLGPTFPDGPFGTLEAFAFDRRRGDSTPGVPSLETFIELFCAADHGMVTGYTRAADRIVPTLREDRNSAGLAWGLAGLREGVDRMLDNLALPEHWPEHAAAMGPAALRLVRELTTAPTIEEARAFASFPFDDDQSGEGHAPLARPFTLARLINRILRGPVPERASWPAGAIAISPPPIRAALQLAGRLRPRRS